MAELPTEGYVLCTRSYKHSFTAGKVYILDPNSPYRDLTSSAIHVFILKDDKEKPNGWQFINFIYLGTRLTALEKALYKIK